MSLSDLAPHAATLEVTPESLLQIVDRVVDRTVAFARLASPTGDESEAAALVASWWRADGLDDVTLDEAGNVWASSGPPGPARVAVAAHLDTVFGPDVALAIQRHGSRLVGPSVGDNAVAVAALSEIARLVREVDPACSLVIIGTVGEEGLGNLRGVTAALERPVREFSALIALEGNYLDRVGNIGVGSLRWRVTVTGPGGHAWEESATPSAVHAAATAIAALAGVRTRTGERTVNVGSVQGGEAVNARARRAEFVVDMRAVEPDDLRALEGECRSAIDAAAAEGIDFDVVEIGRRPGGRLAADHPLVLAALSSLERFGRTPSLVASSTDANAAHPAGVPAVALGVTLGRGEHTTQEWIDVELIGVGLCALASTIVDYSRGSQ